MLAGAAARLRDIGAWAFANDEAWVALSTRVVGLEQYWLALSLTPVAWAGLVKLAALAFGGTEASLRAVPFLFGCLTMWAAYRAGERFAGHPLGGVLALAAVAFDPLSVVYSKILKPYTAETFFCLLAIDQAAAFVESRSRRDLVVLGLVLMAGLGFATSQLFVALPVTAALLLDAVVRRDTRAVRDLLAAAIVVGLWDAIYYRVLLLPRLPTAADPYWGVQTYLSLDVASVHTAWTYASGVLVPALSTRAIVAGALGLAVAGVGRGRVVVITLVLLLAELAALSVLRKVPVSQVRILLFATTAVETYLAAALAFLVVRAWRWRPLGVVATAGLVVLARDFIQLHPWRDLGRAALVENTGSLVRRIEQERRADDLVLVHEKAAFVFAYYQRATPVLLPLPILSVGYIPAPADAHMRLVLDVDLETRLLEALATGQRVWFVASRLRPDHEKAIRSMVSGAGTIVLKQREPWAFLLLLVPPPTGEPPAAAPAP